MEPPSKKPRRLLDDDSSSDSGDEAGGVLLGNEESGFKINEDYARRFEHNKKREELQKLESKFGKGTALGKRRNRDDNDDGSDDEEGSSSEEDEDEDGELATMKLDAEIQATLQAIRSKDPRVYDKNVTFYSEIDETSPQDGAVKAEKPMTLRDYHRENLLKGGDDVEDEVPKTFAQEQADLKKSILKEVKAVTDGNTDGDDDEDDFLVAKSITLPAPTPKVDIKQEVEKADRDPETFLSNFLSSRAWIPSSRELHPFESEDEAEEDAADAFEEAYNFRFEDPNKVNERLKTHARDAIAKQSVRREEKNTRKKLREAERSKKEEEKKQRETEKNRLRKLKIEELQGKVNQIKEVAGIHASGFTDEDWVHFLDDAWDDKEWEEEMQKRFGEDYYAEGEQGDDKKKKKPKKPTWDDDIDITDLVPDYENDDEKPRTSLSDDEMMDAEADRGDNDEDEEDDEDEGENPSGSKKKKKSKAQEKRDKKREARKERMRIEEAVDRNLDLDISLLPGATKKNSSGFRYRETSPQSFGLTARDILMADDSHLNEFAGLKKLASFRDPEKKRRDQKKLGKKARLRQWRKDTFGDEEGPRIEFGSQTAAGDSAAGQQETEADDNVDIREDGSRKKKRKRSKKH
ncbi:hypothetical protein ASPZODRAFT_114618 [Penicilliopsis zonata CBS 506.65]|uniref:Kri1-like C-terminal domain-containing protein n=1 Tax=Penicilliopsis zonata CBS 506.65 TaxID=1073090 RepID=A0A1L9SKN7_9EURO|nr:hypothetical protein ASPZODRAFT_114618 [Penicilliopsis zonata CBS 506.65]OJJ47666.1 hypothetical protein ASPZODRAFT_114618 [Penicilliopsis zonata CBS 506.65]